MATHLIVLAAGQGSRMQSDLPKVLHRLGGVPLFAHALAAGAALEPERRVLVVGHGGEQVRKAAAKLDPGITIAEQAEQLGTAHAVAQARAALAGAEGTAFILYGDTPFVRPETLERLAEARAAGHHVVVSGFTPADPARYGRLVMDGDALERIVEFKDATEAERAIGYCNGGIMAVDAARLFDLVDAIGNDNAAGEYYLTDIVEIARARGLSATAVTMDEAETLGINTRAELSRAEALFQAQARAAALENGVTLVAPETVFFAQDTMIGRDAVIEPNVVFGPGVTVESGATIRAFCHLEGCHVGGGAEVGPFARLRPGAELSNDVKIGNFVEIKNSEILDGAKVNHLSYVGDATVGEKANLGAGTVTCNYDGVFKHRTQIGAHAFIGSSTMLVAPVKVGAHAMTGSGTVVTSDVPDGDLAIGRARQVNKPGLARRMMDRLKAMKAARQKETT
ncbi:bifunctional UDP-N-acetylglucosamine diphosphorylase/glucosamine-1-phosphate N-acetyltransferase GlmU [Oceaniglobus roseus]|uniref:bifunctional UDP-N-acetylglucosamine diphosphorylase/glucosamine-1-phosphate N-acetyltransferase GlmU n=1 Tax=Oceaniglobus roseus TaxID=1737570 RepID=UPI000C7ED239|nr:bifunctional UDP-N-acetylglucosamine diphosphorylase/glucosamine-1-phosphate N-acetyltransferase GlmU [Kandeliimicrobium roseum]